MFVHNDSTVYAGVDWNRISNLMGPSVTMFLENNEEALLFTDSFLLFTWKSRYGKITERRFLELFGGKTGYYRIPAFVLEVVLDTLALSVGRVDGDDIEREATVKDGFPFRMYNLFIATVRTGQCRIIDQAQLTEQFGDSETYGSCDVMALKRRAEEAVMEDNILSPLMVWGGVTIRAIDRLPFESERESDSRIALYRINKTTKEVRRKHRAPRYHPFANAIVGAKH